MNHRITPKLTDVILVLAIAFLGLTVMGQATELDRLDADNAALAASFARCQRALEVRP